jgi:toxin ParE1/3/4
MPTIQKREAATRDLVEHFVYLAENAGLDTAERFLRQAEASFTDLARQPKMGAPLNLRNPDLANIRKWRVKGFDNHLVFYEPRSDGISVVRVLHAASDWWQLLGYESQQTPPGL